LKGVIFPTGAPSPIPITLPANPPPGRASDDAIDIDLKSIFPNGALSVRVVESPELNSFSMPNQYRVYVSRHTAAAPINQAVNTTCGIYWTGNVLWLRYCDHRDTLKDPNSGEEAEPEDFLPSKFERIANADAKFLRPIATA
jgi:hypothetical protein